MSPRRPNLGPDRDGDLVRQTLAGSRTAFDALTHRHQERAVAIAYRLLGNTHDALEVVQEAFLRAFCSLEGLADPDRFRAWLLRIVTNQALNRRRSRSARPEHANGSTSDPDELLDALPSKAPGPGSFLAAEELAEQIRAILAELPLTQRAALVLFSVEQIPQKEVAAILGCSVEAVKWHVFQARRKLRARLRGD